MMFENADPALRMSIRGTSFLVNHENRIFALTAKHNVKTFHPNQYRVPAALGSHRMLEYKEPFTCELHNENFEDFVVITIDEEKCAGYGFDRSDAAVLSSEGIQWSGITEVTVIGFPTERNDFDPEEEAIFYREPVILRGTLNGQVVDEGFRGIQIANPKGLSSFAGLSGCPVFDSSPGSSNRLLGIVLEGSRDTTVSQLCHFLDVRVVPSLIACDDLANAQRAGS